MKRYSIYWTFVTNKEGNVCEITNSCDVIASNFAKALDWLLDNKSDFNIEYVTTVHTYDDVNIAE